MGDRCFLERGELACFGVSRFNCKARRCERKTHSLTAEYIEVTVYMGGSKTPLIMRQLPVSMSFREIKRQAALLILEEIEKMCDSVRQYWKQPPFPGEE
jgi:hypothetical protein